MEISFMMLARYAELSQDGKISMLSGDIDTVRVQGNLPLVSGSPLCLIAKLAFPANECGRRYVSRVQLVTPDGGALDVGERPIDTPPPAPGRLTKVAFVLYMSGLPLPAAGEYAFRLLVDGVEVKRLPLYVEVVPPSPGGGERWQTWSCEKTGSARGCLGPLSAWRRGSPI
jgi:hypothetical protein